MNNIVVILYGMDGKHTMENTESHTELSNHHVVCLKLTLYVNYVNYTSKKKRKRESNIMRR